MNGFTNTIKTWTLMAALAGLCALAQTDIKKSLAYSTLAHLGIMGCALGLGHPELAVLHMAMHAFFKATLFLGAGSVIHGCHHEQDMLRMGGLLKKMPLTAATFVAATLSNCAVPFLAGWYSKDAIIEAAYHGDHIAIFAFLSLWTGSLWGKPMWGTWWVWDARLTSELILFFLYLGYIALTSAIDDQRRGDRAGALIAIVGAINVPIIYFSVKWWNTLHQGASVSLTKSPSPQLFYLKRFGLLDKEPEGLSRSLHLERFHNYDSCKFQLQLFVHSRNQALIS